MQRGWQAKSIWAARDSGETGRAGLGLAFSDCLRLKKIKYKGEGTAQWRSVCLTHTGLCFDAQCLKGKEIEFNLRANSCVSGEREKHGICSSFKVQWQESPMTQFSLRRRGMTKCLRQNTAVPFHFLLQLQLSLVSVTSSQQQLKILDRKFQK